MKEKMIFMIIKIQEIPKPPFMIEKSEDEWTEIEKQIHQQYLQKVKEQQEERDKLRKVCFSLMSNFILIDKFLVEIKGFNCRIH